jgi:hypothetical protein
MTELPSDVRRVVTGHTADGRSYVAVDDRRPFVPRLAQIWSTDALPTSNTDATDGADRSIALDAPDGGSRFWIVRFPATYGLGADDREAAAKRLAEQGADVAAGERPMHATRTVDYVVVLQGQVTLILDDGEIILNQFDCAVQRGTSHHWENRTGADALVVFVLLDAQPLDL